MFCPSYRTDWQGFCKIESSKINLGWIFNCLPWLWGRVFKYYLHYSKFFPGCGSISCIFTSTCILRHLYELLPLRKKVSKEKEDVHCNNGETWKSSYRFHDVETRSANYVLPSLVVQQYLLQEFPPYGNTIEPAALSISHDFPWHCMETCSCNENIHYLLKRYSFPMK